VDEAAKGLGRSGNYGRTVIEPSPLVDAKKVSTGNISLDFSRENRKLAYPSCRRNRDGDILPKAAKV
jgi:hypothetical protein